MSGDDPIVPESKRALETLELVFSIQEHLNTAHGFDEPVESAIIGGYALALRGVERVTEDVDLAVSMGDFYMQTRHVRAWLESSGFDVVIHQAGEGDPLGGV